MRMSTDVQRLRLTLVAVVLAATAVAAVPLGVLWPSSSRSDGAYAYADVEPLRQQWWLVLTLLAAMLPLNVAAQALATMALVRERGAAWATWGGVLMFIGASLQAIGITFLAGAYYFATDAEVPHDAGTAVLDAISHDQDRLYGTLVPGAVLALVGTIAQVVGLLRAGTVPRWIPVGFAFIAATFFVPGEGAVGLLTSIPTAVAAVGLACYVARPSTL